MADNNILKLGIDVGSTTIKAVVIDDNDKILHLSYQRHFSNTLNSVLELASEIQKKFPATNFKVAVSGSGSLGIAEKLGFLFVQEVVAALCALLAVPAGGYATAALGGRRYGVSVLHHRALRHGR